jgi:signal transduction histidine kinase
MTTKIRTAPVVLVVDDHDAGRFAKARALRRAGFHVEEAATGAEALELAAAIDPDLVCLDVNLPDMSGLDVCRQLKTRPGVAPQVLQVSATAIGDDDLVAGLDEGADTYLIEPVPAEILIATARALLRVRSTERALFDLAQRERAAREDAERANRSKDEFLATLSHELRTPLNAMSGWMWQLRRRAADDAIRTRALDAIDRNLKLQARLIDDLLDISRIEKGKIELALRPVDLRVLVSDAVEAMRARAGGRVIDLQMPAKAVEIIGDRDRLMQVLGNLLNNAVQFTAANGRIAIELAADGDWATLSVQDDGAGIEPAFLPFVFESFRQADSGPTRRSGGLGLGLAIVKRLAELHGGSVSANSDGRGTGSRFQVRLPRATDASRHPSWAEVPQTRLNDVDVLVIEDDPDARELIRAMLGAADAAVTVVSTVADALTALERRHFDVILSDIAMADRDGLDLMRTVRDLGIKTPAVAITALSTDDDRARTQAAGFNLHLTKPVEQSTLIARIGQLLGK